MEMKNVYIWDRALSPIEIRFLNKINSERFEKTAEIPEDMNSLTFTAVENSSIKMIAEGNPTVSGIYYRKSLITDWMPYTIGERIELSRGTKVQFKNDENTLSISATDYVKFVMAGKIEASGNIQSMLNYSDTCSDFCYYNLFSECVDLVKVPELPALTVGQSSYGRMFFGCVSLKTTPALPATDLAQNCYVSMFRNCISLRTVPDLPADELASNCYDNMFNGCSSLLQVQDDLLHAEELKPFCYAAMFGGCINLKKAPNLPASLLASGCYYYMFYNCQSLNTVKVNFTEWDDSINATDNWLTNVSANGTFIKPDDFDVSEIVNGPSSIPAGWDVVNFSDLEEPEE